MLNAHFEIRESLTPELVQVQKHSQEETCQVLLPSEIWESLTPKFADKPGQLPVTTKFPRGDPWQAVSRETLGQFVHQILAVSRSVASLLLELNDAISDEPVAKSQAEVHSSGSELLSLLVDLNNRHHQRLEVTLSRPSAGRALRGRATFDEL